MSATISDIRIGIIADSNEQQHVIRSAVLALGFQVAVATSPKFIEERWFDSDELNLWIIDLVEQDQWDEFIDTIIDSSPARLMFSDGNAPPTYSGKYPRWQKRLLAKLSELLDIEIEDVPVENVQEKYEQIKAEVEPDDDDDSIPELINLAPGETFEAQDNTPIARRIWVLAASLGGPAAVKMFLDNLKPNLPIAFILAQHIDEGFQSLLGQVLGRDNHFELIKDFNRTQLKHGQILIAPADYQIKMDITRHIVTTNTPWNGPYDPCINDVMRMVGEQYGSRSGAIIFSGMGDDGAESAEYMHSVGGKVWAQTADSCANSSQPDSVRETGFVDYNGSPAQLAAKLMNLLKKEEDFV